MNIGTVWRSASKFSRCAPRFLLPPNLILPGGGIQTLQTIQKSFPRVVAPYLPAYIAAALHHLLALYPTFVRYYLTDSVPVPNSSEGEPIELYRVITGLVDFVSDATHESKSRVSFDEGTLGKLVNALVQWSQMTKENVSWLALLRGSLLYARLGGRMGGRRESVHISRG